MEALAVQRTPELIAAEINSIKQQTRTMLLYNSIEIGRRLTEAKAMIEHGEWGNWLEKSVDYSPRTAQNLMRVFEEYGSAQITFFGNNAKTQALADLSYTQAVALLGVPEEEREQFLADHDVKNMSTRELQQAIKERDQALKEKQKIEKERDKLREETSQLKSEIQVTNDVLKDKEVAVKTLQDVLTKEREQSKAEIQKLVGLLDEAKSDGSSDEKIRKLEEQLKAAERQVESLNEELKKPIEIEQAIVEKVPEEVERELEELRKKAAQQINPATIKFKVVFDGLVKNFQELLASLGEIKEADQEAAEKYKNAVVALIGKMQERL